MFMLEGEEMRDTIDMARESWIDVYGLGHDRAKFIEALKHFEALVRADSQRTWVGLTDEERMDVLLALNWDKQLTHMDTAKSIEAKLKEKNT
jgi:hypothetical protein